MAWSAIAAPPLENSADTCAHRELPRPIARTVWAGKLTADYRKNQSIYEQGQVADTVFFIQKGRVKVTVRSEQGREAVVAILHEGQFFGEGCLNDQLLRTASAAEINQNSLACSWIIC